MPDYEVHDAHTQLPRLKAQAESNASVVDAPRGKRRPDILKGKVIIDDSFFDPLPEAELAAWEGR